MYILANRLFFPVLIIVISCSSTSGADIKFPAIVIAPVLTSVKEHTTELYAEKFNLIVKNVDHLNLYWEPEYVFPVVSAVSQILNKQISD